MNTHNGGDAINLYGTFSNLGGTLVNPSGTLLRLQPPDGPGVGIHHGTGTYQGTYQSSTGIYAVSLTLPRGTPGVWTYQWNASGDVVVVAEGQFFIRPSGVG